MIELQMQPKSIEKNILPSFQSLNIYSSSRVFNQRVNNSKLPLQKYREEIRANNCSKSNDADTVDPTSLRKIMEKDGLLYSVKKMKESPQARETMRLKALVCVCMYNESKNAINLTLEGIYKNLPALEKKGIAPGDIAVVLIQDGILKLVANRVKKTYVNKDNSMVEFYKRMDRVEGKFKCDLTDRISTILNEIQNYDRKGMSGHVQRNRDFPPSIEKNVSLVYQNLWYPQKTNFKIKEEDIKVPDDPNKCLRLFTCFKHTNGTKLSSHLLFFEGFCRYLKPEYCVLLDVGTTPAEDGLANLLAGFNLGSNIGGVTGLMNVDINFESEEGDGGKGDQRNCFQRNFYSIERAQEYQYTISHFLDKNQESALGFLHVLPGAWSAYRYDALIKSDKYEPNLLERSYFKMILNPQLDSKDYQQANMYLAEDRILSLGIYCQMDSRYILKYIPDARAYTDPMKDHITLMNQRRRWINSSLFAFMYVWKNYYFNVMDSNHNFFRKYITLNLSMIFAMISTINSYIAPSIYFFVLYATIYQLGFPQADVIASVVCLIYLLVFMSGVAGALTGSQWSKNAHYVSHALTFFTVLLFALVIYNVLMIYIRVSTISISAGFTHLSTTVIIVLILLGVNLFCFFLLMIVHIPTHCKEVRSLIVNTPSYMAYTGAYSQTMVIHAFCNVDDVSWGTKGSSASGVSRFLTDKVYFVSTWLLVNSILTFIFIYIDIISRKSNPTRPDLILLSIAIYGSVTIFTKTMFAVYHHLKWVIFERCLSCCTKENNLESRLNAINGYWKNVFSNWIQNKDQIVNQDSLKPQQIKPRFQKK